MSRSFTLARSSAIAETTEGFMTFSTIGSPRLWFTCSFVVFAVHVGVVVSQLFRFDENLAAAATTLLVFWGFSAAVHWFVLRSQKIKARPVQYVSVVFGVLSTMFWITQFAWMSIPGVLCAIMIVVSSNRVPGEMDS